MSIAMSAKVALSRIGKRTDSLDGVRAGRGRTCARAPQQRRTVRAHAAPHHPGHAERRLFVGGLTHKALKDKDKLLLALEDFGKIEDMCTFEKQKYAFVTFAEPAAAENALAQTVTSDLFNYIGRADPKEHQTEGDSNSRDTTCYDDVLSKERLREVNMALQCPSSHSERVADYVSQKAGTLDFTVVGIMSPPTNQRKRFKERLLLLNAQRPAGGVLAALRYPATVVAVILLNDISYNYRRTTQHVVRVALRASLVACRRGEGSA
eukprot:1179604-Prorocentrum_minimum.AAC.4